MPKITELRGFGIGVEDCDLVVTDPATGQPVANGDGSPRTVKGKRVVFVDRVTGDAIVVPLPDESRLELVRRLTGVALAVPRTKGI